MEGQVQPEGVAPGRCAACESRAAPESRDRIAYRSVRERRALREISCGVGVGDAADYALMFSIGGGLERRARGVGRVGSADLLVSPAESFAVSCSHSRTFSLRQRVSTFS